LEHIISKTAAKQHLQLTAKSLSKSQSLGGCRQCINH